MQNHVFQNSKILHFLGVKSEIYQCMMAKIYDGQVHEPDVMIDDHEIPTFSQSMTNELLCLDLNDSFSERRNSISLNRNFKQSSISNYFTKK